jgi:hypothetical protein
VQPEKPAPSLASTDLVMSRAKVERRSVADVDSGHDLLVGNGGVGSTSIRQGTGHGAQGRGLGTARRGGASAAGMEHGAVVDVAWLDAGWGCHRKAAWGGRTAR